MTATADLTFEENQRHAMPDEVILSESYGSVLVDALVPCVIVQFHGFANRAEFINIMETGLAYYEAHATAEHPWGWIGDVRRMGAIPKPVQDWLTTDWNIRAFKAGVREVSIVVAENVLGQLATQQYVQNTTARKDQYEIATATYPSLEAAKQGARAAFLL
ncbi:hypothetical protein JAO73_01785 [Hymenobacter sp. BT523]|uniref:hypothetical protein n=1 Tax=Hymenobacter sp. BT523 TaxID=2795725 RepID=UPI0018EBE8B9|nr:hypothetical protein [Hymenobacter sp. BT523]MBJ6107723.1 hypothetical protein [Hymenobacter sp. BT523]